MKSKKELDLKSVAVGAQIALYIMQLRLKKANYTLGDRDKIVISTQAVGLTQNLEPDTMNLISLFQSYAQKIVEEVSKVELEGVKDYD